MNMFNLSAGKVCRKSLPEESTGRNCRKILPEETARSLSVILTGGATDKPCNCSSYIRTPSLKYTNSITQIYELHLSMPNRTRSTLTPDAIVPPPLSRGCPWSTCGWSSRGEAVIYRLFGTATLPTGTSVASSRGEGGFYRHFGTRTIN